MEHQSTPDKLRLRPSGYVSRLYEIGYGSAAPFYDLIVWWGFLPLGGGKGMPSPVCPLVRSSAGAARRLAVLRDGVDGKGFARTDA